MTTATYIGIDDDGFHVVIVIGPGFSNHYAYATEAEAFETLHRIGLGQ